jgi:cbb3-type cytochrome oxidase maturation protein
MGVEVLYLLIPATSLLALIALGLFIWAIHSGQFDDLETPAIRILFEDGEAPAGEPEGPPAAEPSPPTLSAGPGTPALPRQEPSTQAPSPQAPSPQEPSPQEPHRALPHPPPKKD